jgi:uroporphyrinogen decarboxylase
VDAAILFSDIVVPLRASGIDLDIVPDVGPVIAHPIRTADDVAAVRPLQPEQVAPISQAVETLVSALGDVPLIGFAGAPFTLASYLVEGGPSRNHERTKAMMFAEPETWHALMTALSDITIGFLRAQLDAGVDAIQVFDSWAGTLSLADYRSHVLPHSSRVFQALADHGVPMTHFGVGTAELLGAMGEAGASVVGVDWRTALVDAAPRVGPGIALQGNLDPVVLLAGWPAVERAVRDVVEDGRRAVDAGAAGHVFNLGHGVLPATDPGIVTDAVALVHSL